MKAGASEMVIASELNVLLTLDQKESPLLSPLKEDTRTALFHLYVAVLAACAETYEAISETLHACEKSKE